MKRLANLQVVPLSAADAERIASWRYPRPYAIYDTPEARRSDSVRYMLDPSSGYHAVRGPADLVGFCSFGADARVPGGTYDDHALDIGAGMDPALVGQKLGAVFLTAIIDHAISQLNATTLRATIASWNDRALRAANNVGFHPVATFRNLLGTDFTILTRP